MKNLFSCVLVVAAAMSGCTQGPKSVPCSNAGDCSKVDAKYQYCLEGRCVECIGDASCPNRSLCKDGSCRQECKDGRDCPGDMQCASGFCAQP